MDSRIIYFLIIRTVLVFLGFGGAPNIQLLFWFVFFLLAFALSSGWVYFFAYKYLDNKALYGILLLLLAVTIDFTFSMKYMNGSKEFAPSILYAATGLASFVIIYFTVKNNK